MIKAITPIRKEYHTITVYELEQKIEEVYGFPFSINSDQELGNTVMEAHFDGYLDSYDESQILQFAKNGSGSWLLYALCNDLVIRGLIPVGDYIIDGTW